MIKNLENKMQKMQESSNKDLEELKSTCTETNNTTTEIKNTLEGINIRISEAEEWISELGDKMVEITSEEQNENKKNEKSWGQTQRPLGPYQTHQHLNYRGPRRRRGKKGYEKNFEDYSWKFPHCGKGNSQSSPRGMKSPIQDKPKEKYAKTHTNQANKD